MTSEIDRRRKALDPSDPGYAAEIRRQCLLLRDDPQEKEILDWIEAVADYSGWK